MEVFRSGITSNLLRSISMYKASRKLQTEQVCNVLRKGIVAAACLGFGFCWFQMWISSFYIKAFINLYIWLAGEILQFHVIRTPPGRGNVTVSWKIIGQNLELNFANSTGQLFFPEVIAPRKTVLNYLEETVFCEEHGKILMK